MANTIKIKRGLSTSINSITLAEGELAFTTDTNELYIGTNSGNKKLTKDAILPAGGTAGQVLSKKSEEEYDVEWITLTDFDGVAF